MFGFIKDKIKKVYNTFTSQISTIFSRNKLDEQLLKELSVLLISADTGAKTTNNIITQLKTDIVSSKIKDINEVKTALEQLLLSQLSLPQHSLAQLSSEKSPTPKTSNLLPKITLLVGINGSGKTTFSAKLANIMRQNGKRVILVAGDTFRAAATQQLMEWGEKIGVPVFVGRENQDPASVIFDACKKFKDENYDHIIIDTAGRLQTKVNLMKELEKIRKILDKQISSQISGDDISTWLTVDAMIGQNSLRQAELFEQATALNGIILTKLDGTGKGGIVFSITQQFKIPILYTTFGEKLEDIKVFDAKEYVHGLLYE
ncbi:MAG: signal recognition particle-docking protein FtsY [Candidatus Babeliales bacterium]|jgi:fused signal recognition particle receptor